MSPTYSLNRLKKIMLSFGKQGGKGPDFQVYRLGFHSNPSAIITHWVPLSK